MQFKLDENLPPSAADLLRGLGHDVMTVYDQGLQSCTDPEVLAACQDEGKVLLSLDLDFSNILVLPTGTVCRAHRASSAQAWSEGGLEPLAARRAPSRNGSRRGEALDRG